MEENLAKTSLLTIVTRMAFLTTFQHLGLNNKMELLKEKTKH